MLAASDHSPVDIHGYTGPVCAIKILMLLTASTPVSRDLSAQRPTIQNQPKPEDLQNTFKNAFLAAF